MDFGPMIGNILIWLVVGLVIGGIASLLIPGHTPGGILGTIVVGVVGAFVGGALIGLIFGDLTSLTTVVGAFVVAVLFSSLILFFISNRHSKFT